jgi:cell division septal protein FtsQ
VGVAAPADRRFRRARVVPSRRRRSWIARTLAVLQALVTAGAFLTGVYLLGRQVAHARALHVDHIVVHGNERLSRGEVLALLGGLRGEHVLKVNLDRWRERVLGSPWVEQAALRRVLPSTIEVFVRERQPMAVGRVRDALFLVDATGRIIDEYGPNYAAFDLPIVDGLGSVSAGEPLVDEGRAALAAALITALRRDDRLYRRVSQIEVVNDHDAVVILQGDRALIHLGDEQFVERLRAYVEIADALRDQVPEVDAVDLRIDGKVYVRPVAAGRKSSR